MANLRRWASRRSIYLVWNAARIDAEGHGSFRWRDDWLMSAGLEEE